jgi:glycosyltransferase involved in cell wall biosynthesis
MRIALFHNLPSGGAKRALYEWTRRLATRHELGAYALSSADHAFCDIRPLVQEHYVFDFVPYRLFQSPWGRLNRLQRWRDLGKLTRLSRQIAHEINTGDYDVVFAHPCSHTIIPTLLRFVQIPSVYYLHEPFGPTFVREFQRPYIKLPSTWRKVSLLLDPFFNLYTHRLDSIRTRSVKNTTRLLANSLFTQRQMKLAYQVDAPVCHYGVDMGGFYPMPDVPKQDSVISVGELSPRKGFDFLIESLSYIPSDRRPVLKLACNNQVDEERRYLESMAVQYGVELDILGHLNTEQLVLEYNKARICIYAPVMEPLGLVPLEAMACGTPVVGVAEGGVCETVRHGETGLLTKRDPQQFANAITELLVNTVLLDRLGKQGPVYVRDKWSWDDSVARLEAHLSDVAAQGLQSH